MKLVTQDYGCGTSSSILDYGIEDVILVSPSNYNHIYDVDDDLFFIGHDFLYFLWDSPEKINRWKNHNHRKAVWCFERIDSIVDIWKQKSHSSINSLKQFVDEIYACDEDDIQNYGYEWLPQWASCKFYNLRNNMIGNNKILFSGQAGRPEYEKRNELLSSIIQDKDLRDFINISNVSRNISWDDYCSNLLSHSAILNPVGILKAFNTRTYEVLYSGRLLLQQTYGHYDNHIEIINCKNIILFNDINELKKGLSNISDISIVDNTKFYNENNIFARFKNIGIEIK